MLRAVDNRPYDTSQYEEFNAELKKTRNSLYRMLGLLHGNKADVLSSPILDALKNLNEINMYGVNERLIHLIKENDNA